MARITAPSRPKINQPIRNATTAPIPIAAQFTDTIFHYLLSTILFSPWHRSPYVMPGTLSRVIGNPSIINYKIPTIKNKNCNRVMARIMSRYFLLSLSRIHITTIRDGFFHFLQGILALTEYFCAGNAQSGKESPPMSLTARPDVLFLYTEKSPCVTKRTGCVVANFIFHTMLLIRESRVC